MASAFAHIAVPAVLYAVCKCRSVNVRLFLLTTLLAVLPDADVLAFEFDIPYQSQWGHRGFTHSLVFAAVIALFCCAFYRQLRSTRLTVFWFCFIACASHGLLDALTNGGFGVAFYWPFSLDRLFFPVRPIQVSPIGVGQFFSERGLKVLRSELVWVFMPALIISMVGVLLRKKYQHK
jgi:inner membrane protein